MGSAGIGRISEGMSAADKAKLDTAPADIGAALAGKADETSGTLTAPTIDGELSSAAKQQALTAVASSYNNGDTGTFGSDCTTWDLGDLACDTLGGFQLTINGRFATTDPVTISLRVNGSTADINYGGMYDTVAQVAVPAGGAGGSLAAAQGAGGVDGSGFTIVMSCPAPSTEGNPLRVIHCYSAYWTNPTTRAGQWTDYKCVYLGLGEIVSVGLSSSVASGLASESRYTMRRI